MKRKISDAFNELDYFTQEQIARDDTFKSIFPEKHLESLDCRSIEHFPKFSMNEFFGAFILVFSVIGVIGYFTTF